MPQKAILEDVVQLVLELRKKGMTYAHIHDETSVSTGKIAEICAATGSDLESRVEKLERRFDETMTMMMKEDDVMRLLLSHVSEPRMKIYCICGNGIMQYFERPNLNNRTDPPVQGYACPECHHEILSISSKMMMSQ